jgi:hypothetical protein
MEQKKPFGCSVAIYLNLLSVLVFVAVAYFYLGNNSNCPECPPPAITKTPVPCSLNDLSATLMLDGAAGSIYGTAEIKNISAKACTVAGNNFPKLNYDQSAVKNLGVAEMGLPSVKLYTLDPGSSLYARTHFPNGPQCSSAINEVTATLSYEIAPNVNVTFDSLRQPGGPSQPEFTIQACSTLQDMTQVSITNLSDQPVR